MLWSILALSTPVRPLLMLQILLCIAVTYIKNNHIQVHCLWCSFLSFDFLSYHVLLNIYYSHLSPDSIIRMESLIENFRNFSLHNKNINDSKLLKDASTSKAKTKFQNSRKHKIKPETESHSNRHRIFVKIVKKIIITEGDQENLQACITSCCHSTCSSKSLQQTHSNKWSFW